MKIIFSRKGFDSASGGCPSPIIDGRPISLPIPECNLHSETRYRDLRGQYGALVRDLTRGRLTADCKCHLDPDIRLDCLPREVGWRGTLGQSSAAQSHLENKGVNLGDLFLFFGLFRPVENDGGWRFVGTPEHRIWGWLQIGEIVPLGPNGSRDGSHVVATYSWLKDHPHARPGQEKKNALYIASDNLILPTAKSSLPGSGILKRGYRLTASGANVSTWRVPGWLHPPGGVGMTYHGPHRWNDDGTVSTVGRGQEFVATIPEDKEAAAVEWIVAVLNDQIEGTGSPGR